jgi:hypothetical protein
MGQASTYYTDIGYNNSGEYGFMQAYRLSGQSNIAINPNGGNVAIGSASTNHKLRVVGDLAVDSANLGDGLGTFQHLSGSKTAASSGVSVPIFFCDHTASGKMYIVARTDSGNVASAVFDFTVAYGSGGAAVRQSINNIGSVTDITAVYDNWTHGAATGYHIDITVTYSGSTPTIYWATEGMGASNWYAMN